jgi:hypothetical protein
MEKEVAANVIPMKISCAKRTEEIKKRRKTSSAMLKLPKVCRVKAWTYARWHGW